MRYFNTKVILSILLMGILLKGLCDGAKAADPGLQAFIRSSNPALKRAILELPKIKGPDYDIDKLAKSVAVAETGGCKVGSGKTHRNAFGIMQWKNGKRSFRKFNSCEESYAEFKRIWTSYYGRFPDLKLAKKWTGNDRPTTWLAHVNSVYGSL